MTVFKDEHGLGLIRSGCGIRLRSGIRCRVGLRAIVACATRISGRSLWRRRPRTSPVKDRRTAVVLVVGSGIGCLIAGIVISVIWHGVNRASPGKRRVVAMMGVK